MIRVLLAGNLNAGMAEDLRSIPEFEIQEIDDFSNLAAESEFAHVDAVVVDDRTPVKRDFLQRAAQLRLLIRTASNPGEIDLEYAGGKGIYVRCTPFATSASVAAYTLALILACLYRIGPAYHDLHADSDSVHDTFSGCQKEEKMTLGIVGFGRIGSEVGRRAFNLGMEILYCDIEEVQPGFPARRLPLEHLLACADIVSLHLPSTPDTRNLLHAMNLSRMKPSAILVDLSAPGVVDAGAVLDAVRSGALSASALDGCALPQDLREAAAEIAGVYPVNSGAYLCGPRLEQSSNDVISILKEFFNV
ncbi:MAG: NAD(P)-dependent oxidoreductase [Acidobacteriota bacterium]|nr:NAD(P)-dependent oxidoreductase [Acidobacteriota bacterium]